MNSIEIVRSWKDEGYLSSLDEAQRSRLPGNPAGPVELGDEDLSQVDGGTITFDSYLCGGTISYLICISALWPCIVP
jgi:mersacidin/lichenicidin family type 2 lantibiotic